MKKFFANLLRGSCCPDSVSGVTVEETRFDGSPVVHAEKDSIKIPYVAHAERQIILTGARRRADYAVRLIRDGREQDAIAELETAISQLDHIQTVMNEERNQ